MLKSQAQNFKASMGGIFSGVGSSLLGMLGLGGGLAGLTLLGRQAIDMGSTLSDLALQLRIGTTELQALQAAAQDAGVDGRMLENTLRNLNQRTQEAADGNRSYQEAFARLGIDLRQFYGLPLEQKMARLGEAYRQAQGSLAAYNDISDILGTKTGPKMLEVLERLATEGMEGLTQSAMESGQIMDEATVAALDRAGDEIGRWQNKIIIMFGGFLADMGSAFGRVKWWSLLMQKTAEGIQWIEEQIRNAINYILGVFNALGRALNATFVGEILFAFRDVILDIVDEVGSAVATLVGVVSSGAEEAIRNTLAQLKKIDEAEKALAQKDRGKSFGQILNEEIRIAENNNRSRKQGDLWTSFAVDYWKNEVADSERELEREREPIRQKEAARKEQIRKVDSEVEIKEAKATSKKQTFNDSYMAKIGGGGLTAMRFDLSEKQLSEAQRQTKILNKIAENTQGSAPETSILMK